VTEATMRALQGQVALITGATRGIGRGIALQLASQGAVVVGTATSGVGAQVITEYLAAAGALGAGVVLDVNDGEAIIALVESVQKERGAVSILINNAGITRDTLLLRMKDDDWDSVLDTDLRSVFRLSRAVLRGMIKNKSGRIVSIASVVGSIGNAGQANYAAAKAGILGFTRALAREVASRNITVNCVAPGFIATDMTRSLGPEQQQALLQAIPLGRLGTPDDVAAAVAFLVSPGAGYITGSTIHINGGMFMG
jgi:3-oxoacyl-[acyl-carrier protein] reductase